MTDGSLGVPSRQRLAAYDMNVNGSATAPPPVCLRRDPVSVLEAAGRTSFDPPRHPHGSAPDDRTHPAVDAARTRTLGNDNSSLTRQSRTHSTPPDPTPGTQYAGVCYQKMGQVLLGLYRHPPRTVTYDGRL